MRISRMQEILERSGAVFTNRVFTKKERIAAQNAEHSLNWYASAFAAKEAVFKALVLNWDDDIDLREIEISRGTYGEPQVVLHGTVRKHANDMRCVLISLSISYETDTTIAFALVNTE